MRGIKSIILAIIYYVSAMLPSFLFLVTILIWQNFKLQIWSWFLIVCIYTLVWMICKKALVWKMSKTANKYNESISIESKCLKQVNEGLVQIVFMYASPAIVNTFLGDIIFYVISILILHTALLFLYYNSSTYLPNIVLFTGGYHAYQLDNGSVLFSKQKTLKNTIGDIRVKIISDYIYLEDELCGDSR